MIRWLILLLYFCSFVGCSVQKPFRLSTVTPSNDQSLRIISLPQTSSLLTSFLIKGAAFVPIPGMVFGSGLAGFVHFYVVAKKLRNEKAQFVQLNAHNVAAVRSQHTIARALAQQRKRIQHRRKQSRLDLQRRNARIDQLARKGNMS